jgi:hypothetical protein
MKRLHDSLVTMRFLLLVPALFADETPETLDVKYGGG